MEPNSSEDQPAPEAPADAPLGNAVPESLPGQPTEPVAPEALSPDTAEPASAPESRTETEVEAPTGAEVTPEAEENSDGEEVVEIDPAAPDELTTLAEASQKARLSSGEEERMATLLKEAVLGGRAGVARAVLVLPRVPWIVGVRAIEAIWPELTAGFRTQLLSGLGKEETDAARRIRLSLARALFKIDVPVALKLATSVARELRDKETGTLTPKQAQIFANVFIGRGKPWLAQLPLTDLKPADVDALVHCAVLAVFTLPHPPVTQLGVLKWAAEQGRLGKLDTAALETLKKGVARWSAKWQAALRKEVAELPEEIVAVLKPVGEPAPAKAEQAGESGETSDRKPADGESEEDDEDEDEDEDDEESEDDEDEDDAEGDESEAQTKPKERPVYEPRPQKPADETQRERPVYTPRNAGANVPRNFNLTESLRNIEAYANSLRTELAAAKARQKEDRRRPEKSSGPIITGEPTIEELARLNQQLEARNTELQERIKDLTQHSEDLATSMGAMSSEPVSDTGSQLRTLLALKLQEDFADFLALKKETNDVVVQQHYRSVLEHVFEVLQQLEVPLKAE